MTLDQLIYQVYERLDINADDTSADDRLIEQLINQQRSLWIRNEYNKNRSIDVNVVQDLGCIPIIPVDRAVECCDVALGCTILRTAEPIPNTIELHHDDTITRVGPIDMLGRAYKELEYPSEVQFFGHGRVNSGFIYWFKRSTSNGLYIYLVSRSNEQMKLLTDINVQGVFEDPREAGRFRTCDNKPCWSPSHKYPMNDWMSNYVLGEVVKIMATKIQAPQDLESDNKDNTKTDNK